MDLLGILINHKKRNIVVGIITIVSIVGLYYFIKNPDIDNISEESISVSVSNIKNKSVPSKLNNFVEKSNNLHKPLEESEYKDLISFDMGENLQILFKDSTINKHTVRIARMLQMKFTDSTDFKSHYREVEDFLRIQFEDEIKIEELLNFYKKFTEFKMSLDKPEHPLRQRNPETIDEAISLNNELQQYRRGLFGSEEADVLWGHEVKTSEYQLRKSKIMRANSYGEEKEKLIAALNEETWGDKAGEQGGETSFSQYENALTLYREDFSNMTDDESKEKRKELRHRFLTSDEAKRLDFFEKKFEADPEMKNFDPVAMEKEYALEMEREKGN